MPTRYVIRPGDGVSKVAYEHGLFPDSVWDDPANAELRELRKDMNMLVPGDVLILHDLRPKTDTAPTGQTTQFVVRTTPAKLRLQIAVNDDVLADEPYVLTVDGERRTGRTDDKGVLDEFVSPRAHKAVLTMDRLEEPIEILIGRVQPVDTLAGVKTRLNNLGFSCGAPDGPFDDATREAVIEFQRRAGITQNGDWQDGAFQRSLQEMHDSSNELPEDADQAATGDAGPATGAGTPPAAAAG